MAQVVLSNYQPLIDAGCQPLVVTGPKAVYDYVVDHFDRTHVSVEAVDRAAARMPDDGPPIVLDIEDFDLRNDFENASANLRLALMRWKSAKPRRKVGLYGLLPERNFWTPVRCTRYLVEFNLAEWLKAVDERIKWRLRNNRAMGALLAHCDMLCPSIYALDPRYDAWWAVYADGNLREAESVALGKPVYPFIQPIYKGNTAISMPMWRRMVEFCVGHPLCHATCVHSADVYQPADGWIGVVQESLDGIHI